MIRLSWILAANCRASRIVAVFEPDKPQYMLRNVRDKTPVVTAIDGTWIRNFSKEWKAKALCG